MYMRITTNGVFRDYGNNLQKSYKKLNKSMRRVETQREFNAYSEDVSGASRAFQLRRDHWRTGMEINNSNYVISKYETAWSAVDYICDGSETESDLSGIVESLRGLNDATGSARSALGQSLTSKAESIVKLMNSQYGDQFIFAGADGKKVPFSWSNAGATDGNLGALLYRGIDISTPVGLSETELAEHLIEEDGKFTFDDTLTRKGYVSLDGGYDSPGDAFKAYKEQFNQIYGGIKKEDFASGDYVKKDEIKDADRVTGYNVEFDSPLTERGYSFSGDYSFTVTPVYKEPAAVQNAAAALGDVLEKEDATDESITDAAKDLIGAIVDADGLDAAKEVLTAAGASAATLDALDGVADDSITAAARNVIGDIVDAAGSDATTVANKMLESILTGYTVTYSDDVIAAGYPFSAEFTVDDYSSIDDVYKKALDTVNDAVDKAAWKSYQTQFDKKYPDYYLGDASENLYDNGRKLYAMSQEATYVDIGLGMNFEDGTLVGSSAYNSALSGLNFLDFGTEEVAVGDETYGWSNNLAVLLRDMGSILRNCDSKTGTYPEGWDNDNVSALVRKISSAIDNVSVQHVKLSGDAAYLKTNLTQLESQSFNLNEQILDIEQPDMAESIESFLYARYSYNAALQIGNDILTNSLLDYLH